MLPAWYFNITERGKQPVKASSSWKEGLLEEQFERRLTNLEFYSEVMAYAHK